MQPWVSSISPPAANRNERRGDDNHPLHAAREGKSGTLRLYLQLDPLKRSRPPHPHKLLHDMPTLAIPHGQPHGETPSGELRQPSAIATGLRTARVLEESGVERRARPMGEHAKGLQWGVL